MLERPLVIALEGVMFGAVATFALLWLALVALLIRTLIRVWRASGSADPFKWIAYIRSPQGTEVVESIQLGRRLVRFCLLCVAVAAIAGVAAAICATVFHIT